MVLRKLTMALLGMGVMLPGFTHALAVRDIQTKSSLGQPLRVEVELSDLGDLTSEDIKIGLATQEDFDRLGIERSFFLAELRFEVVVNAGSRSYIKITSAKRVSEPFLDFVIRITWPGNTRLQELPILLDPPMSASARPAVIEAPVVVAAPVVAAPEVARVEPQAPVQAVEEEASPESVYRVRRHDNLWAIAQRVRPGNNVSVHRMMQALFKANPGAFVANNINMLRNGEVLRVPTLNEVQSAADRATAAVPAAKIQTLSAAAKDKPARQQINATASANRKVQATPAPRVEMRLVAPAGGSTPAAGRHDKSGHAAESSGSIGQAGVAVSGKGHPGKRKSPSVLASEVAALENQLKSNDKTIAMQNATLARLEAQLKARAAQEQQSRQKAGEKSDKGLTGKALATLACGVATQSFLSTEAKAADAPAAATGGSSMMPVIAGVVVLLLVIGAIIAMKGKSKPAQRPSAPPAPAPKPVAPKPQEPVVAKPAAPEPKKPLDAAEEAQGYISMERYPQAVGVLNKALAHTPDRADLHLMLLEIYVKQQDRQSFEEQYVRLESLGEIEAIMRADELKSLLPKLTAPAPSKEDGIEFVRTEIKAEEPHHDAGPSLEDLEKDFALSLSQPNLKALDIEIREMPSVTAAAEQAKVDELDSLLEQELEFSFEPKPAEPAPAPAPVAETPFELDFSFTEPEPSKPAPAVEELSLDSLDAFLEEHKATPEAKPEVIEPVVEEAAFDFEKALADYKGETGQPAAEPEVNLAEGFELEEFNVSQINLPVADVALRSETQTDLDAFEGDFSLDEFAQTPAPVVEPAPNLAALDGGMDLGSAAAAFDAELAGHGADLPAAEEAAADMGADAGEDALSSLDREFGFLATTNENTTRLELARAYAEMGDKAAARDLLEEVVADGDENQKNEAQGMLMRIA